MKERNIILWVYIIIFGFFFLASGLQELSYAFEDGEIPNPFDYARITDVDYKAVLIDEKGSRGKAVITERLTFDIHAAFKSNPFWELWRDLCEDRIDGLNVDYNVLSVKQIMPDGSEVYYGKSPKLYWLDSDYLPTSNLRSW